jgi:chromosome partitioning protein
VVAVANQKGGVGKSTTAVSLGAALSELGHEVLVVDLDPQGNASTGLGIRHLAREVTTYEVLLAEASIDDAIVETPVERLSAIPSTIDLAGAEIELVSQFSREMLLRRALEPIRGRFDFILLDCPPSLGLLTVNALAAADELIVPIQCEYYALEGLGQLLRNVRLVQQNVNPRLRLSGIVLTMFDARTKLSEQVVAEVRRYFGPRVYDTVIPRTVRLSEAPGFGQPITVYDPASKGARVYRSLADEVANRTAEGALPAVADLPSVIVPSPRTDEEGAEPPEAELREPSPEAATSTAGPGPQPQPEPQPETTTPQAVPSPEPPAPAPREDRPAAPLPAETNVVELEPTVADEAEAEAEAETEGWPLSSAQSADRSDAVSGPETGPGAPSGRPVRVVHIGEIEARDLFRTEPPTRAEPVPDRSEERAPQEEPRKRRKLFRKGGRQ